MLVVPRPRCVIVIPESSLGASFIGRFTDCDFYIEQQSLPVKFTCDAWRQCLWLYDEYVSLRRDVKVTENGKGTFTVTITTSPEDKDESNSTGYIFHLDGDGELVFFYATCINLTFISPLTTECVNMQICVRENVFVHVS